MRKPRFGEMNIGSLAGAITGSIGGLFAPAIPPTIAEGDPAVLVSLPILGIISFVISGTAGWLFGGQVGPRIGLKLRNPRAEMAGGAMAGLIPVVCVILWAWYMLRH